jgi:hypothetical protein
MLDCGGDSGKRAASVARTAKGRQVGTRRREKTLSYKPPVVAYPVG